MTSNEFCKILDKLDCLPEYRQYANYKQYINSDQFVGKFDIILNNGDIIHVIGYFEYKGIKEDERYIGDDVIYILDEEFNEPRIALPISEIRYLSNIWLIGLVDKLTDMANDKEKQSGIDSNLYFNKLIKFYTGEITDIVNENEIKENIKNKVNWF